MESGQIQIQVDTIAELAEKLGVPADKRFLLFDGCNYRSLLFTNPLFRGLFHF